MNRTSVFSAIFVLGLAACDTMNRPISGGTGIDFDPLRTPGSESNLNIAPAVVFTGGQIVRATMNNTAFFKVRPKGEADADKLLVRGTSMKVVSMSESYVKVELDGTGEVGWVPAVQLEDPNRVPSQPVTHPGEYQVYPPPGGKPVVQPPGGVIPTVIDPDAPAGEAVPVPVAPKKESTPLPPNGE